MKTNYLRVLCCTSALFSIAVSATEAQQNFVLEAPSASPKPPANKAGHLEVSNAEYTAFLNEAAKVDSSGLYNRNMEIDRTFGGIVRLGKSGHYTYITKRGFESTPVNYVSHADAESYVAWKHGPGGRAKIMKPVLATLAMDRGKLVSSRSAGGEVVGCSMPKESYAVGFRVCRQAQQRASRISGDSISENPRQRSEQVSKQDGPVITATSAFLQLELNLLRYLLAPIEVMRR